MPRTSVNRQLVVDPSFSTLPKLKYTVDLLLYSLEKSSL